MLVYPDYYREFRCINRACRHNCCIGWEIDIDPDTAAFYRSVAGEMGKRLARHVSFDGEPHFVLTDGDRCPFLNEENLCDVILNLGEAHLCGICADHPRFRNQLPGRVEMGLGLCCEEAARLILGKREPVRLVYDGEQTSEDEIIALRDRVVALLQNRQRSVDERVMEMLVLCGADAPTDVTAWIPTLLSLERLDDTWTRVLTFLDDFAGQMDPDGFDRYMSERQSEYEQLLVYLVYRHFANAPDLADAAPRAAFAAFGYRLLRAIGAAVWTKTGQFCFADQTELARLFSSEIEYSDENLNLMLDLLD